MHKGNERENGILSTWSMGGLLALLTRFSLGIFNEGGCLLLFRLHVYSIANNANKVININAMHKHMIEGWNLMYMFWCVRYFNLNVVFAFKLQIQTPHMNSRLTMLQMPLCDHFSSNRNVYDILWSVVEMWYVNMVQVAKALDLNSI